MNTLFLLMAQFDGRALVPVDEVCSAFFPHLSRATMLRKVLAGEIRLPLVQIEQSQKAAKAVHLVDLARYIDDRRTAGLRDFERLHGFVDSAR